MALNYRTHVVTSFLLDATLPAVLMGLSNFNPVSFITGWAGAFVVYSGREVVRDATKESEYHKPISVAFSGLVGGYKYWNKGGDALVGAYNNGVYEASKLLAPKLFDSKLAPVVVEGFESGFLNGLHYNSTDYTASVCKIADGMGQGAQVGASILGLIPLIEPLEQFVGETVLDYTAAGLGITAVGKFAYDVMSYNTLVSGDQDSSTKSDL